MAEVPFGCSATYPEIEFAKLDVDELNDTTAKAGVRVRALGWLRRSSFALALTKRFGGAVDADVLLVPERRAAARTLGACVCGCEHVVQVCALTPMLSIQFSGADETLLRDNIKQLNEL